MEIDQLKERYKKFEELIANPFGGIGGHFFNEKYGLARVGLDSVDNTRNQLRELAFALSFSKHPLIDKIFLNPETKHLVRGLYLENTEAKDAQSKFDSLATSLTKNKVLGGMKIIDLGCGTKPTFAYNARVLGADKVYTVDIIPEERLCLSREQKEAREDHIQLDLRNPDALDMLARRTGGDFDLITSATIHEMSAFADAAGRAAPPNHLEDLALALAKDEGVYFNAEYLEDGDIRLKDPKIDYEARVRDSVSRFRG